MAELALDYRRHANERERGRERPREATPHIQERHDCGIHAPRFRRSQFVWRLWRRPTPTIQLPESCIVVVKRYPRRPDNIRGRRERRADYLPRLRGRSRQVYNHHPYPHTRTRVLANKCSIFLPAYRTYVRYRETRESLLFFRAPV